jgi:hypothetical protein
MISRDELLGLLSEHIGAAKGISATALVKKCKLAGFVANERQIRSIVESLRAEGTHVCGLPGTGYFIAETSSELDATCRFLINRSMTTLRQVSRMRNVALPDLHGQMRMSL